jgi:phenylpyruvate tautomerase PptA (4-oxalocrotonate tautomerase family)
MNEEFENKVTEDEKQDLVKKMTTKLKKSEGQKDYWIQVAGLVPTETSKENYLVQYDQTDGKNKPELRKIFDFDASSSTCKFLWSKNDDVYIPDIDDVKIEARQPDSENIGPQLDVFWIERGKKVGLPTSLRFRNTSFANFSTDYK